MRVISRYLYSIQTVTFGKSTVPSICANGKHVLLSDNRCFMKSCLQSVDMGVDVDHQQAGVTDTDPKNHEDRSKKPVPWSLRRMRQSLRDLHDLPNHDHPSPRCGLANADDTVESETSIESDGTSKNYEVEFNDEGVNTKVLNEKYSSFERKKMSKDYEQIIEVPFGFIRMDHQNKCTKRNRRAEPSVDFHESVTGEQTNIFDEEYFGLYLNDVKQIENNFQMKDGERESNMMFDPVQLNMDDEDKLPAYQDTETVKQNKQRNKDTHEAHTNYFEDEYFKDIQVGAKNLQTKSATNRSGQDHLYTRAITKTPSGDFRATEVNKTAENREKSSEDSDFTDSTSRNIFDEQYFTGTSSKEPSMNCSPLDETSSNKITSKNYTEERRDEEFSKSDAIISDKIVHKPYESPSDSVHDRENTKNTEDIHVDVVTKQEKRQVQKKKAQVDDPKTAYDMAMKIRLTNKQMKRSNMDDCSKVPREAKWTGKTDTHGFRILKNQVLDIQNMPTKVVVNILKDSILYQDEDLLAIDKPYGLPSHGGPKVHNSVGQLLVPLAETIKSTDLQLVHRLDKETTGVMLLAKNPQSQHTLRDMFKRRKVIKKYWVLTKGIPNPPEGVIDIPMTEGTVANKSRMTLSPNYTADNKLMLKTEPYRNQNKSDAITNYKVLNSNNSCSLIECQPETGLKHQIRCHMAFALNTPILGDHKYSHYSKIAPQKLYPDILRRLGIRQAKVRHLPMHLHARMVLLPEYKDGRNLFISARLPKHFVQNMKWLQIKPT